MYFARKIQCWKGMILKSCNWCQCSSLVQHQQKIVFNTLCFVYWRWSLLVDDTSLIWWLVKWRLPECWPIPSHFRLQICFVFAQKSLNCYLASYRSLSGNMNEAEWTEIHQRTTDDPFLCGVKKVNLLITILDVLFNDTKLELDLCTDVYSVDVCLYDYVS
jgi:hypothetical protein